VIRLSLSFTFASCVFWPLRRRSHIAASNSSVGSRFCDCLRGRNPAERRSAGRRRERRRFGGPECTAAAPGALAAPMPLRPTVDRSPTYCVRCWVLLTVASGGGARKNCEWAMVRGAPAKRARNVFTTWLSEMKSMAYVRTILPEFRQKAVSVERRPDRQGCRHLGRGDPKTIR
jgi:hypothetical protein